MYFSNFFFYFNTDNFYEKEEMLIVIGTAAVFALVGFVIGLKIEENIDQAKAVAEMETDLPPLEDEDNQK